MLRSFLTLSAGESAARALHALALILIARAMGNEAFGQLGLAMAITSYLSLLVRQGLDSLAIREVARTPSELRRFTENIIGLRLMLAIGVAVPIWIWALARRGTMAESLLLVALTPVYFALALSPRWSFLALERSKPVAMANAISQVTFLASAALVRSPAQLIWPAIAMSAGDAIAAAYLSRNLSRTYGAVWPAFEWKFWKALVRDSFPMSLSLLLSNVIFNFDVIALGAFGRQSEIGLYAACFRCVTVFLPFLVLMQLSVFPSLVRSYPNYAKATAVSKRAGMLAAAGAIAVAVVISFFPSQILRLLYGASFEEGARLLQVVIWVLPIQASRVALRPLLVAFHLQRSDTLLYACGAVTNVVADFVLIPSWGALGCAVSTLLAESVLWSSLLGLIYYQSRKSGREATTTIESAQEKRRIDEEAG